MEWPDLFKSSFHAVADRLPLVLDVASAREHWLQAELFLHLRKHDPEFKINHFPIAPGCKADFYGEHPSRMVAELKLLGNGYAQKCFDGHSNIDCYAPSFSGERVSITQSHLDRAIGYFLHDVNRLRAVNDVEERYMILVVDRRGTMDRLGTALLAVQLSDAEWTVEPTSGEYVVRIWRV